MDSNLQRQLALKISLEQRLKPKLRRFFRQVADDAFLVYRASSRVPTLTYFEQELQGILAEHYRLTASRFTHIIESSTKSNFSSLIKKQQETAQEEEGNSSAGIIALIALASQRVLDQAQTTIIDFIRDTSRVQASRIMSTTTIDMDQIVRKTIAKLALQGENITPDLVAELAKKEFLAQSDSRVDTIAVTETQNTAEASKLLLVSALALAARRGLLGSQVSSSQVIKTWNAVIDDKTRQDHLRANGQTVPAESAFTVGGEKLMSPGNGSLGASLKNIINCRCIATYDVELGGTIPIGFVLQ